MFRRSRCKVRNLGTSSPTNSNLILKFPTFRYTLIVLSILAGSYVLEKRTLQNIGTMPLSKKRKITTVIDKQEGTSIYDTTPAVAFTKSQDKIASDRLQQEADIRTEDTEHTGQAATQNEERQERFKALQARAVCYISGLKLLHGYALAELNVCGKLLTDLACRRNPLSVTSRKQLLSRKDWRPTQIF